MTNFVHVDQPFEHPGVARAERAIDLIVDRTRAFRRSSSAATLLLAAMVSAVLVAANQLIGTWTEGHLLAAWIVMWTVAFAALALLAAPAARAASSLRAAMSRRAADRQKASEDERLWQAAHDDARVMADIGRAMTSDAMRKTRPYY
jgi:hypothetical protein